MRSGARGLLLVAVAALVAVPVGPSAYAGTPDDTGAEVERVLVLSLPAIDWADLETTSVPHLDGLLAESAVAALSVRSVNRHTSASDGYATLGAGTRTRGASAARLAFEEGAFYEGTPAAEEFTRRTGVEPAPGEIFNLGVVDLRSTNDRLDFGTEVGALADALADAGLGRAVVGTADHPEGLELDIQRQVSVGLMDDLGLVPSGVVDDALLRDDPLAPYGVRYDNKMVADAFAERWADHEVVLVEAGDLVRWDSYRSRALAAQRETLKEQALRHSDELVGMLLEQVDLERDAVVVVGPYHRRGDPHLTIAGVHAPDLDPGLLKSGTTRRSGFVALVDVAPTVLDLLGVERPDSMEGRAFERGAGGGSDGDRRQLLIEADEAAAFRDSHVAPATTWFVVIQAVLWILAAVALAVGTTRQRHAVEVLALATLGYLPATHVAALLPFHDWGSGPYWLFLAIFSVGFGLVAWRLGRRRVEDSLLISLGAIVGLHVVDVLFGAPLQLNAVFGYSPTVAGRFAGWGNLAFGQVAAASLLLAALAANRVGGRRGVRVAAAILAVVIVVDGAPLWGSDVGGVLALVPAAGVTLWMLTRRRIRLRAVALWGGVSVAAVVVFGLLDLTRDDENRTHLGRLFEEIGSDGLEPFVTVVVRKLDANLSVLTSSVWTLMLPVVFAFVGYLFWRAPGALRRVHESVPTERAALAGLLVAMFLGFALNDSGIAVPGVMLGVVNASLVYMLMRTNERLPVRASGEGLWSRAGSPPGADQALDGQGDESLGAEPAALASERGR